MVCFPHINALLAQMNKGSGSTRYAIKGGKISRGAARQRFFAEANQDRAEREMQARDPEGNNLHGILRVIFCIQGNDTTSTQL